MPFDLPLLNYEIELDLRWTRNCIIFKICRATAVGGDNPVEATARTSATFEINNAKFCVPLVTLSVNDDIIFLKHLKRGVRRIALWNK